MQPHRLAEFLWENPVLLRETSRRREYPRGRLRAAVWLGVGTAVAGTATAAHWLSAAQRSPWEARAFLLGAVLLYLLIITGLIPSLSAGLISGEREQETLEALRLTSITAAQLVAGKLVIALRPPFVVLAALLPAILMAAHASRLVPGYLLLLLLILVTTTISLASVTLWLSARCRRTVLALALACLFAGVCFWGTLVSTPVFAVRREDLWWYASPAWQAAILCLAEPIRSPLARPLLPEWAWCLVWMAFLTAMPLLLAERRLARADR